MSDTLKLLLKIIMTSVLVNNYVLNKFLGICPFLGVSKKLDSAIPMSIAVIFVMVLATAVTWPGAVFRSVSSPGTLIDDKIKSVIFILHHLSCSVRIGFLSALPCQSRP